jgi:hypothetical protein
MKCDKILVKHARKSMPYNLTNTESEEISKSEEPGAAKGYAAKVVLLLEQVRGNQK